MFRRKITHRDAELYLKIPVSPIRHEYGNDWELEERRAKAALRQSMNRAREILPRCRKTFIGQRDLTLHDCDYTYIDQLLQLKHFLAAGRYIQACEKLVDVLHFFRIEDKRILYQLIRLLEDYL